MAEAITLGNRQGYAPYARTAIRVVEGIPVFSEENEYTRNYELIARDHLDSILHGKGNPFIPDAIWNELEASTIEFVRKYARPGDRILDAGVGLGRLLDLVPELERYGMDISFNYLQVARSKGIDVCYAQIEDMPYRPGSFDLVVCTDVLEHVRDLNSCCSTLLAAVRPGGALIVRVPYRENLENYVTSKYRFAHLRNFDEHGLFLLFDRVFGCNVLEWKTASPSFPGPFISRLRLRRVVAIILRATRLVSTAGFEFLRKLFYLPLEINMVIRKPQTDAGASSLNEQSGPPA